MRPSIRRSCATLLLLVLVGHGGVSLYACGRDAAKRSSASSTGSAAHRDHVPAPARASGHDSHRSGDGMAAGPRPTAVRTVRHEGHAVAPTDAGQTGERHRCNRHAPGRCPHSAPGPALDACGGDAPQGLHAAAQPVLPLEAAPLPLPPTGEVAVWTTASSPRDLPHSPEPRPPRSA